MKNKKQGISLIVLVITIIVIVILAVAVILSIANNNPIDNAKNAVTENTKATLKEAANLEYATMYANAKINGEVMDTDAMTTAIRESLMTQGFSATEVAKVTVTEDGLEIEDTKESEGVTFTKNGELAIGCEVTASNGEEFYVIGGDTVGTEISNDTKDVILLSKYNLKKENGEITLKQDPDEYQYQYPFSDTFYWSSVDGIAYPDSEIGKYPDLNDEEKYPIGSATSVITTAKEYGKSLGVTGRLMTYEEAVVLKENHYEILSNVSSSFWLASAASESQVWMVVRALMNEDLLVVTFNNDLLFYDTGVRPVITVSKSLIK